MGMLAWMTFAILEDTYADVEEALHRRNSESMYSTMRQTSVITDKEPKNGGQVRWLVAGIVIALVVAIAALALAVLILSGTINIKSSKLKC